MNLMNIILLRRFKAIESFSNKLNLNYQVMIDNKEVL